jgi:hypothetical protein
MNGRRVYPDAEGRLVLQEGDYAFDPRDGKWYARPPSTFAVSLDTHDVTEHEDGTITVSPSIVSSDGFSRRPWEGYLELGAWRQA